MKNLKKVYWHDGIFMEINFTMNSNKCDLDLCLMLYETHEASERNEINFSFSNIENLVMNINTEALKENLWAGNIDSAILYENDINKIDLYLMEGHISFSFDSVTIYSISNYMK